MKRIILIAFLLVAGLSRAQAPAAAHHGVLANAGGAWTPPGSPDGWWYSNLAGIIDQDTGEPYGPEMPAIRLFETTPPGQATGPDLREIKAHLARALASLGQAGDALA